MNSESALVMIAWSRIWSPLVDDEQRAAAWDTLDLPDSYKIHKVAYWSTFHVGSVTLILHAALRREGAGVREDWLRVINHLGLSWNDAHLPPDQLGAACEIYACAVEDEEPMLVEELRKRYLHPWCEFSEQSLIEAGSPLLPLVQKFNQDLGAIELS